MVQRGTVRVTECGTEGRRYLQFETLGSDGTWHVVCATGLVDTVSIWSSETMAKSEDPTFEWKEADEDQSRVSRGFFDQSRAGDDGLSLALWKRIGSRQIEETLSLEEGDRIHVRVQCAGTGAAPRPFRLGGLMTHIYFVPEGKAARSAEPLDFSWLPLLHKDKDHVCGDHFFRSPVVMVASGGFFAAIVPDLDVLAVHRPPAHALDLRVADTMIEAPRLSYGLCPWRVDGHVYAIHPPDLLCPVEGQELVYEFDLFVGSLEDHRQVPLFVSSYLWQKYGARYLHDVRPQVLPFEEYGRRYVYEEELKKSVKWSQGKDSACAGIDNIDRRGANFHAWENDLNVAYGIKYYGTKWNDEELRRTADGIVNMFLRSPRREGAFPCVYNFRTNEYEGTLYWTARAADPLKGYDTAAMGVTTWWSLILSEDLGDDGTLLQAAESYAQFLRRNQLASGAIPTYFFESLTPARQLLQSATTCISGAVLARVARLTGQPELSEAAMRAGRFVIEKVIPGLVFDDFEAYYSCSPKPLHAIDYWTGIRPHCNLSIQWGCDQMLSLYRLTGESRWLEMGEYLLSILSLYQQVWNSSLYEEYLFGGFGVMNTDGEWNDGRQARFVPTYADYYLTTGKVEYLERAVAACRAAFALCDIPENHENGINNLTLGDTVDPRCAGCGEAVPGRGYAPENIHHLAADMYDDAKKYKGLWTGMNWSAGGGLAASAFLERHFGSVCVDLRTEKAIGIDGLRAEMRAWNGRTAEIEITSSLKELKFPFLGKRRCLVRVHHSGEGPYELVLNGESVGTLTPTQLEKGLEIDL